MQGYFVQGFITVFHGITYPFLSSLGATILLSLTHSPGISRQVEPEVNGESKMENFLKIDQKRCNPHEGHIFINPKN